VPPTPLLHELAAVPCLTCCAVLCCLQDLVSSTTCSEQVAAGLELARLQAKLSSLLQQAEQEQDQAAAAAVSLRTQLPGSFGLAPAAVA
jgi:hypothetical protein